MQSQCLDIKAQNEIRDLAIAAGAVDAGFTTLGRPLSFEIYKEWIDEGHQGEMEYLKRHLEIKAKPQIKWPSMQSAMVLLVPYQISADRPLKHTRTALYSQDVDYHENLQQKFSSLLDRLQACFPREKFLFMTDSAPLMERDLAHRAGLGWIGKNSCLISRTQGSLFFIAEILTSLTLEVATLKASDHCGTCSRCIDVCPTAAINENRTLDARKCISYWTIESKTFAPPELSAKFQDWLFGCDLCQTVCPWNEKVYGKTQMQNLSKPFQDDSAAATEELRWILNSTESEFKEKFNMSPILRSKHHGIKRNALVVIQNKQVKELKPDVQKLISDPNLGSLASSTLASLETG